MAKRTCCGKNHGNIPALDKFIFVGIKTQPSKRWRVGNVHFSNLTRARKFVTKSHGIVASDPSRNVSYTPASGYGKKTKTAIKPNVQRVNKKFLAVATPQPTTQVVNNNRQTKHGLTMTVGNVTVNGLLSVTDAVQIILALNQLK